MEQFALQSLFFRPEGVDTLQKILYSEAVGVFVLTSKATSPFDYKVYFSWAEGMPFVKASAKLDHVSKTPEMNSEWRIKLPGDDRVHKLCFPMIGSSALFCSSTSFSWDGLELTPFLND